MANFIGNGVTLNGFFYEDDQFTVILTGGIVVGDIGKALTIDTAAANSFKLAGDGDPIHARLETVENRVQESGVVGTASFKWSGTLPIKSGLSGGAIVAVGSTLVGAGGGEVKNATPAAGVPIVRVFELVSSGTKAVCRGTGV